METYDGREWLALHLFYHHAEKFDALLRTCVIPTANAMQAEGQCQGWFFIRYWEGGPHLRVRFLQAAEGVEEKVRAAAAAFIAADPSSPLTKEQYYQGHKFDGVPQKLEDLPWYEHGQIVRLPYQPETERYGGVQAIRISEQIFVASTQAVAELLTAIADNQQKRVVAALDLMLLTALCLGVERAELSAYFLRYAEYWSSFVDDPAQMRQQIESHFPQQKAMLQQRLDMLHQFVQTDGAHPVYRPFANQLQLAASRLEELGQQKLLFPTATAEQLTGSMEVRHLISRIAFSQIHMTNNRLGVQTGLEHYLGYLLHLVCKS